MQSNFVAGFRGRFRGVRLNALLYTTMHNTRHLNATLNDDFKLQRPHSSPQRAHATRASPIIKGRPNRAQSRFVNSVSHGSRSAPVIEAIFGLKSRQPSGLRCRRTTDVDSWFSAAAGSPEEVAQGVCLTRSPYRKELRPWGAAFECCTRGRIPVAVRSTIGVIGTYRGSRPPLQDQVGRLEFHGCFREQACGTKGCVGVVG